MSKYILMLLLLLPNVAGAIAKNVNTVQHKIMVIPYTKEGEEIRTVL